MVFTLSRLLNLIVYYLTSFLARYFQVISLIYCFLKIFKQNLLLELWLCVITLFLGYPLSTIYIIRSLYDLYKISIRYIDLYRFLFTINNQKHTEQIMMFPFLSMISCLLTMTICFVCMIYHFDRYDISFG